MSARAEYLERREQIHPNCILCSRHNPVGLKLQFESDGEGGARTYFDASSLFQGYPGMLHGGVTAALLDAVMTNCLFMRGIEAVTGDFHIRYLKPVPLGERLTISASIASSHPPLYVMEAKVEAAGETLVRAEAKFMKPEAAGGR